ncbi:hypothetical protein AVEN_173584-1 [Araneus ventricosus]|uniref:Uncharacterized protein n=1 Tax=Araneus ventricosus TaxID=182803 RepID=A0A4Y2CR19_ARAVE|nr:hypothetical protein AVEN_173584-1 [Araneus ventricosus]
MAPTLMRLGEEMTEESDNLSKNIRKANDKFKEVARLYEWDANSWIVIEKQVAYWWWWTEECQTGRECHALRECGHPKHTDSDGVRTGSHCRAFLDTLLSGQFPVREVSWETTHGLPDIFPVHRGTNFFEFSFPFQNVLA